MRQAPTELEIRSWPVVVPLHSDEGPSATAALQMSRQKAYQLAKTGHLPVKLLRLGHRYLVRRVDLLAFLGIQEDVRAGGDAA